MNNLKKYLPYISIGLIGLIIAIGSFYLLNNKYVEPIETKSLLVTSQNINMYEPIKRNDLKIIQVPIDTNTEEYLNTYEEVVGKLSSLPLNENEPILKNSLLNKEENENIVFITLNTLYAKTGGAKSGDIVDIYKIDTEQNNWIEGSQAQLIAENVVVISLADANGTNVTGNSKGMLGTTSNSKIETIKLGVKPEDVKFLVSGSVEVENGYVLVVKHTYNQETQPDINLQDYLDNKDIEDMENEDTEDTENTENINIETNKIIGGEANAIQPVQEKKS